MEDLASAGIAKRNQLIIKTGAHMDQASRCLGGNHGAKAIIVIGLGRPSSPVFLNPANADMSEQTSIEDLSYFVTAPRMRDLYTEVK